MKNNSFLFLTKANYSRFSYHSKEIWNQAKCLCSILSTCKISNELSKRFSYDCTLIFSMSCRIVSVTSYLSAIEAKIYKMATYILLKFLTLKWDISRTIWRIEVSDGSLFCIFHALLFELNFLFDGSFPLSWISWSFSQFELITFASDESVFCCFSFYKLVQLVWMIIFMSCWSGW